MPTHRKPASTMQPDCACGGKARLSGRACLPNVHRRRVAPRRVRRFIGHAVQTHDAAKRPGSTSPKYKERQASAKSVFRPSESDNGCVSAACSRASRTVLRGIPISVSGFQLSGNLVNSRRRFCSFCCSVVGRMNWSGDWMPGQFALRD